MAERLGRGLQNLLRRFESVRDLKTPSNLMGFCILAKTEMIKTRFGILLLLGCLTGPLSLLAQDYGDYRVVIDVEGNGFAHYATVYFDDESWDPQNPPTYGWDMCCDATLLLGNSNQPHVFTEVVAPPAPANTDRLAINGLPHVFEHTIVPMGFLPGTNAAYTFTFSELYTLPAGMTVELEDYSMNVTQDLLTDSTYDTWGATSDLEDRFAIHFYPFAVGVEEEVSVDNPEIKILNDEIQVFGLNKEMKTDFSVIDISGREVFRTNIEKQNEYILSVSGFPRGTYLVNLTSDDGQRWSRKMIR